MAELTAEQIAQRAFDLDLLSERQLQDIWGEFGRRNVPADEFVQLMLRREFLTNFQLDRLLKGERGGYFYGQYKVLYMVAGGSFARVYRAAHKETGVVRALKVLRKRYSDDPAQTEHFVREGQVGLTLRHANIVPIYEVYSNAKERTHFLVMEFIEGRNLREFLKIRKKLDPAEATRLMIDIVSGLRYAFEHGVFHRDLKLTNILISSKGQAKLVDFGLAGTDTNVADEKLGETINARTIDYAGLERATGVRRDDQRSDVYFLGVIYYHMLVGKSPLYETRDRIQRLAKSRYTEVVPIQQADPTIAKIVAGIVTQAMQVEPDKRYQNPGQMLIDLNVAADRLASGDAHAADDHADSGRWEADRERLATALAADSLRRGLMIVESNSKMQDVFREGLKKAGYRVLVISDPRRAVERFQDDNKPADVIVFCTGQIGEPAVAAFQEFASGEQTRELPAILLLAAEHGAWAKQVEASLAPNRVVLQMPLKLSQLLEAMEKMMSPKAA